jgi:thiol-disulfide isomerase/thioredoxin
VPLLRAAATRKNQTCEDVNMKTKQLKHVATVLAVAASATLALAAQPTLKVGDPAPKLQTGKWIQGEPVNTFQPGKAYVVEFWATWCGPCRVSIPHLNETYQKFKDKGLIVVGQDCWERDDALVAPFVKKMGDQMTYCVALDNKADDERGKMANTWMAAAGRNGIPSAFLVDTKGRIAWIGHPMELKDKVIEAVLAGTFDVKQAAADYDKAQQAEGKMRATGMALNRAMTEKNWDEAMTKVEEMEKLMPEDARGNLDRMRFNILLGKEDYPAAYKLAARISEANKGEAMLQNDLAWQIATGEGIKERDLKLAETIATRGNDAAKGKDPAILDTLARVKFMQGNKEEAIALQEKALNLAETSQQPMYQKTLDSYKKGELPEAN